MVVERDVSSLPMKAEGSWLRNAGTLAPLRLERRSNNGGGRLSDPHGLEVRRLSDDFANGAGSLGLRDSIIATAFCPDETPNDLP